MSFQFTHCVHLPVESREEWRESGALMSDWKEEFRRTRAVPPHSQTARLSDSERPSKGFQLSFRQLDGVSVFQKPARVQLRVTLFDTGHQLFFGRTWKSSFYDCAEHKSRVDIGEVVLFHTSLCLPCVVAVVELVSLSSQHALGCGFGILQLFSGSSDAPSLSGDQRMLLYQGTPRTLLIGGLQDAELNKQLVAGVELIYSLKPHPPLQAATHLLPPNTLLSPHTHVPGLTHTAHSKVMLFDYSSIRSIGWTAGERGAV
ncbi:hypothetical protein ACEWY4_000045 [Coilia grayii]|uniref:Nephronophthisis 4 n=1 Tax=Coilia grayii TaxID=363190 RepID=A0ABD1KVH9_9TELE